MSGLIASDVQLTNQTTPEYAPDATFYTPHQTLEIDYLVEINDLPSPQVAHELFSHYIHTVHDWFPILPFPFEEQIRHHYATGDFVPNKWLAMLNLVFAIGARHQSLLEGKERQDNRYLSRAVQLLGIQESVLVPLQLDISSVQVSEVKNNPESNHVNSFSATAFWHCITSPLNKLMRKYRFVYCR